MLAPQQKLELLYSLEYPNFQLAIAAAERQVVTFATARFLALKVNLGGP